MAIKSLEELLHQTVKEFADATGFPIAFGGYQHGETAVVSAITGNRTVNLNGLRVHLQKGLGGRAAAEKRARFTRNYALAKNITHDYDEAVLSEGITSLLAIPIVVDGHVRAVLYGGGRQQQTTTASGTNFLETTSPIALKFSHQLSIFYEVEKRITARALENETAAARVLETLRVHQAELRALMTDVTDKTIKNRLAKMERSLATLGITKTSATELGSHNHALAASETVRLTPRELDVIVQAAVGLSNDSIGKTLGLTESTVKSYMKSAMSKLDAATRHEAVTKSRLLGLIL